MTWALLVCRYDVLPLQLWDESRNANSALEMAQSGNWAVPTYDRLPDHWNTKPPLLIWTIAALMRSGMPNLLALRLPAMLAGGATVLLVWLFLRFSLQDRLAATVAAFLSVSSVEFSGFHVGRTGDYDAPLTSVTQATPWCVVGQIIESRHMEQPISSTTSHE